MATATATKEAPAPAVAKTDKPAEVPLTEAQIAEARALREGNPAEGIDGLTFVEIASRLGLKSGAQVSKALAGVPAGRVKTKGTVTPHERKPVGTIDWDSAVASVPALAGSTIAWRRASYCMVRADSGRSGVSSGRLIVGTGTPWATLCEHLTVHGAPKGASAETAGKERSTWCKACAAGEAGVVGKRERTAEEVAAEDKPKGKSTKAEPVTPAAAEKAALLATAREGGAEAVKQATAKPAPKGSRASKNAARAAAALAKREAAAAAKAEGEAAEEPLDSIA